MPSMDASRAVVMNRIMGVLLGVTGPTYLSGRAGSSCLPDWLVPPLATRPLIAKLRNRIGKGRSKPTAILSAHYALRSGSHKNSRAAERKKRLRGSPAIHG